MTKLDEIKKRAQFFKRGSIIPSRVLRCSKRKLQHTVTFGCDAWVLPTKTGYLLICDTPSNAGLSAVRLKTFKGMGSIVLDGSPYHKGGTGTHWQGNFNLSDEQHEKAVLELLAMKNGDKP